MASELSACLALVRPVGMNDDAATEWLTVAMATVAAFAEQRPALFRYACRQVRSQVSHHGQIVPKIMANSLFDWERKSGITELPVRAKPVQQIKPPEDVRRLIADAAAGTRAAR